MENSYKGMLMYHLDGTVWKYAEQVFNERLSSKVRVIISGYDPKEIYAGKGQFVTGDPATLGMAMRALVPIGIGRVVDGKAYVERTNILKKLEEDLKRHTLLSGSDSVKVGMLSEDLGI